MDDDHDEVPGDHDADLLDESADNVVACPHCGDDLYDDAEHCPSCGAWLVAGERDRAAHRRGATPLWKRRLMLLAVILAIAGLLLYQL